MKLHGRSVIVTDGNVDKALRKFKKKINDSGLLDDLKSREFYEKPTTERKRKKAVAKNRWRKLVSAQQLPKKNF